MVKLKFILFCQQIYYSNMKINPSIQNTINQINLFKIIEQSKRQFYSIFFTIKMFIIQLDYKSEQLKSPKPTIEEDLANLRLKNNQNIIIGKKSFTLTERFYQTEDPQQQPQRKFSDSFRKMMNKVINRVYRRNSFIKNNQQQEHSESVNKQSFIKETPKTTFSLDYPNRKNKIFHEYNKLKIQGVGKTQNQSNLLQKQNPFMKTSISFAKSKEFKKKIYNRRTRSLTTEIGSQHSLQNGKQNSFILNNTRYCTAQFKRIMLEESFKVGSFIPKITAKQNYQQMQQLLKGNNETKKNKIEINKKLFHKKLIQRQKINLRLPDRINQNDSERIKKQKQKPLRSRQRFQPWTTSDDFHEQIFKRSRKQHY